MRSRNPDDSGSNSRARALDEFAVEDCEGFVTANSDTADGVFCFECEAQPEPGLSVSGSLIEIAPAEVARSSGLEPLSRIEMRRNKRRSLGRRLATRVVPVWDAVACGVAGVKRRSVDSAAVVSQRTSDALRHGKRATHQLALRMQQRTTASHARMMSECDTIKRDVRHRSVALAQTISKVMHVSSHAAINLSKQSASGCGRVSIRLALDMRRRAAYSREQMAAAVADMSDRSRTAARSLSGVATATSLRLRALARPMTETALDHQEFHGSVVAVALAVTVVGYGSLAVLWRAPKDARVTHVTARPPAAAVPVVAALGAPPIVGGGAVVPASVRTTPAVVRTIDTGVERRAAFMPSGHRLTALWQRRDTRSLDRAFSTLRAETLAFGSCAMRMTDVDRAVARCEGVTINFQRTQGRWMIARVANR
jgi:hypothetical protein